MSNRSTRHRIILGLTCAFACVAGTALSCGGSGGGGEQGFYSCDTVTTGSNGTDSRSCREFKFKVPNPYLASALVMYKSLCEGFSGSAERHGTWSTKPCPRDASLYEICENPGNTADSDPKDTTYQYFDTHNGVPTILPLPPGEGCVLAGGPGAAGTSGSAGNAGTSGQGGASGGAGTSGGGGSGVSVPSGTCADLTACCAAITDATAKSTCAQLKGTYQSMVGQGATQAQADNACAVFLQLERSALLCP